MVVPDMMPLARPRDPVGSFVWDHAFAMRRYSRPPTSRDRLPAGTVPSRPSDPVPPGPARR